MPSVAVWLSGGPCWLQHLFWPWTALASAWACALPHLGVFFFSAPKKSTRPFLLGPLPSPLKKVGGDDFIGRFFWFSGKKRGPGQPSPTKNQGKTESLLWFFPDFDGIFSTSRSSVNRWEKPRSHPMYGPCSWTFRLGWTVCSHDAWAATVSAWSVILITVP